VQSGLSRPPETEIERIGLVIFSLLGACLPHKACGWALMFTAVNLFPRVGMLHLTSLDMAVNEDTNVKIMPLHIWEQLRLPT
jgi:hypothetical protein